MKMTGHTTYKVFDGYYEVIDKDILEVNDDLYSQNLKEDYNSSNEVSEGEFLSTEDENKLKRLHEVFERGGIPKHIYEKKVEKILGL